MGDSKIIGEELKDYVIKQINVRQKSHGSGQNNVPRTEHEMITLNANTSWIKLASAVSLTEDKLTELGFTGTLINKYLGVGLAQNYILQGAVSKLQGGKTKPLQDNNYQITETQGIVPMPGIISADIKNLNRGSLKKASIKLKVQDRSQLSIIDALYLRLGYTVLLEWGNSIYQDNSDSSIKQVMGTYSDENFFTPTLDSRDFNNILKGIEKNRERYCGNYDGMLAKISNFSWTFNTDGTYDVDLTLMSWGDVIESLKSNITANNNIMKYLEAAPPEFIETKVYTLRKQNVLLSYFHIFKDIAEPANKGVGTAITLAGQKAGHLITSGSSIISNSIHKAVYKASWKLIHHSYQKITIGTTTEVMPGGNLNNWSADMYRTFWSSTAMGIMIDGMAKVGQYSLYKYYRDNFDDTKYYTNANILLLTNNDEGKMIDLSMRDNTGIGNFKNALGGWELLGYDLTLTKAAQNNLATDAGIKSTDPKMNAAVFKFKDMYFPPKIKDYNETPGQQLINPIPTTINEPKDFQFHPNLNDYTVQKLEETKFGKLIWSVYANETRLGINKDKFNGIYFFNHVDWDMAVEKYYNDDINSTPSGVDLVHQLKYGENNTNYSGLKMQSNHPIFFKMPTPSAIYGFKANDGVLIDNPDKYHKDMASGTLWIYGGFQKNWGTDGISAKRFSTNDLTDEVISTNPKLLNITDTDEEDVKNAIKAEEATLTASNPKPKCAETPVYDDAGTQTGGGYEFFKHFLSEGEEPTQEKPFTLTFKSVQSDNTPGYKGSTKLVSTAKVANPLNGYKNFDELGLFKLQSSPFQYYIKFGFLLQLIKDKVLFQIKKNDSESIPLFEIENSSSDMLCMNSNNTCQISFDPRVCIVRRNNFTKHWHETDPNSTNYTKTQSVFPELAPWAEEDSDGPIYQYNKITQAVEVIGGSRASIANSMNIYLNFECVANAMVANTDDKGNAAIFPFLNSLCKSINVALGGVNNLEPIIDESTNTLHIIDSSPKYSSTTPTISTELRNSPYELQLYGYTPPISPSSEYFSYYNIPPPAPNTAITPIYESTFARNVQLKTAIIPGYATMITIGATAGGHVKGVEATSFAKWNEGIIDTYKQDYIPPEQPSGSINTTSSIEDTLQSFQTAMSDNIVCFGFKKT